MAQYIVQRCKADAHMGQAGRKAMNSSSADITQQSAAAIVWAQKRQASSREDMGSKSLEAGEQHWAN